jgi:hypothetical protein
MEKLLIGTIAGAVMLSLGVGIGGGVVPVEILFVAVGCLGVCVVFAYALVVIIEDAGKKTTRIIEYRQFPVHRHVYRVEGSDGDQVIDGQIIESTQLVERGPAWIARR